MAHRALWRLAVLTMWFIGAVSVAVAAEAQGTGLDQGFFDALSMDLRGAVRIL